MLSKQQFACNVALITINSWSNWAQNTSCRTFKTEQIYKANTQKRRLQTAHMHTEYSTQIQLTHRYIIMVTGQLSAFPCSTETGYSFTLNTSSATYRLRISRPPAHYHGQCVPTLLGLGRCLWPLSLVFLWHLFFFSLLLLCKILLSHHFSVSV